MTAKLSMPAIAAVLALSLAACGTNQGERTLSGAGLGAAAGAGVAAIAGGSLLTATVIGGAAGAVAGALTDKDDVDLGEPAWK